MKSEAALDVEKFLDELEEERMMKDLYEPTKSSWYGIINDPGQVKGLLMNRIGSRPASGQFFKDVPIDPCVIMRPNITGELEIVKIDTFPGQTTGGSHEPIEISLDELLKEELDSTD